MPLDLDPERTAVPVVDASTVVVVRDAGAGPEVFFVRRSSRSGFMASAIVFPGGKLDASDRDDGWQERTNGLVARAGAFGTPHATALSHAVAALREALEEGGVLPVVDRRVNDREMATLRAESARDGLLVALARRGLVLDTAGLEPLGRWVTPVGERRRFDTRFYVILAPAGQEGRHDEYETTTSFWAAPSSVLERWREGALLLAPPTVAMLECLNRAVHARGAMELARARLLDPITPHFRSEDGRGVLVLPGDPAHPDAHAARDPAMPLRFELQDSRFEPRY